MEPERDRESLPAAVDESTEDGPALRDATLTAERIAADEAAAAALRDQQVDAFPTIAPDEAIAGHLEPDEQLLGLRRSAILRTPGGDRALGYGGTLYLTSRRLVHLGQVIMTVQLRDVVETSIASERLLLSLNGGEGLTIEVDRPRTFRTEVASAMRALRR
jgi:hypothetical protein